MKLDHFVIFKGTIECVSGLHIGGSVEGIEIGGVDNPVIKHSITQEPFIPGSSLKGKLRSSLEKKLDKVPPNGEPCSCGQCLVCRIFGAHKNTNQTQGPTRLLVRDAQLAEETRQLAANLLKERGQVYIEQKTENIIDRNKGNALHPRTMERVPAGACFDLELVLQIFDIDSSFEAEMVALIKDGLRLVQETYLGGYGSRGSGQVRFVRLSMNSESFTLE
jgi:CRISPR-associated protein Csm3